MSTPLKNETSSRLTEDDRAKIIALGKEGRSPVEIARVTGRHHRTVCSILAAEGLREIGTKPTPMTYAPQHFARETSTIILVGFTDKARIMELVRQFGAERIRVVPPAPGKVFGEVHHG